MKRAHLLIPALLLTLTLAGCGASTSTPPQETPPQGQEELQAQLQQMTEQLADIQQELDAIKGGMDSAGEGEGASGVSVSAPAASASQTTPIPLPVEDSEPAGQAYAKTAEDYDIEGLAAETAALLAKAEQAAPGSGREENIKTYAQLEQELELMEERLDRCEDEAERDYREGLLSRTDYKEVERRMEELENDLDYADEMLEYRFDMD